MLAAAAHASRVLTAVSRAALKIMPTQKAMSKYATAHASPRGAGDSRPTALQIVNDEAQINELPGKVFVVTGCSAGELQPVRVWRSISTQIIIASPSVVHIYHVLLSFLRCSIRTVLSLSELVPAQVWQPAAGSKLLACLCAGGLGIETARALHATGADVFVTTRNSAKAQSIVDDIHVHSTGQGRIEHLHLELDSLESVRAAAEEFLRRSKKLDVIVNNAGAVPLHHVVSHLPFA